MALNRRTLANTLKAQFDLDDQEAKSLVDEIFQVISDTLETHGTVKLSGFGSFQVSTSPQRMGRNPKTGEPAVISERKRVTFKPSKVLLSKPLDKD